MRLIDADTMLDYLNDCCDVWNKLDVENFIDEQPTVEAEPIIRCKDCKYWSEPNMFDSYCRKMSITDNIIYTEPNHYCGFAERQGKR